MTLILAAAALHAAVSHVTIYGDRARVERTAEVAVDESARVELPLLPDSVDPSSILLRATGAEVERIDVQHVEPDDFPADDARKVLAQLDDVDDRTRAANLEREALRAQVARL